MQQHVFFSSVSQRIKVKIKHWYCCFYICNTCSLGKIIKKYTQGGIHYIGKHFPRCCTIIINYTYMYILYIISDKDFVYHSFRIIYQGFFWYYQNCDQLLICWIILCPYYAMIINLNTITVCYFVIVTYSFKTTI